MHQELETFIAHNAEEHNLISKEDVALIKSSREKATERESAGKLQQLVGEMPFPEAFAYIPWGQHIVIITKCESLNEVLFYIRKTIENGYSRTALLNVIEADYYHTSTPVTACFTAITEMRHFQGQSFWNGKSQRSTAQKKRCSVMLPTEGW